MLFDFIDSVLEYNRIENNERRMRSRHMKEFYERQNNNNDVGLTETIKECGKSIKKTCDDAKKTAVTAAVVGGSIAALPFLSNAALNATVTNSAAFAHAAENDFLGYWYYTGKLKYNALHIYEQPLFYEILLNQDIDEATKIIYIQTMILNDMKNAKAANVACT